MLVAAGAGTGHQAALPSLRTCASGLQLQAWVQRRSSSSSRMQVQPWLQRRSSSSRMQVSGSKMWLLFRYSMFIDHSRHPATSPLL